MKHRINYVELPSANLAAARAFYETAFGWRTTDYGPDYAATTTGDVDLGLDASSDCKITAPLTVIETDDLAASEQSVIAAGGRIVVPVFAFPGGRRFHFTDPDGHELAVWQKT
jgi:uncharacterized protein